MNESLDMNPRKPQKENVSDDFVIDVKISEIVLTPLTCASLVNEILKGILYQKCQIPYAYSWLKSVVDKKRRQTNVEPKRPVSFTAANHFRVVSSAYDTLENIMNGIIKEFRENGDYVKEVVFVFGTTPQCPKEIFTVNISHVVDGHSERNHATCLSKYQQRILRNIFLSQSWMDAIDASLTCTNTYIFLKKYASPNEGSVNIENCDNIFIPSKPLSFPGKLKHVKIKLNYNRSGNTNCCSNLSVFGDVSKNNTLLNKRQAVDSENCETTLTWYQSKHIVKGFKDCYVNKVSACELW